MNNKTNFFIKVVTSIYDIKVFSKYAKEGIFRAISYAMLLSLILATIEGTFAKYKTGNFELNSLAALIITHFGIRFINLLINCVIVTTIALLFTLFMKMIVKYIALYSLILYAATLPLIIQTGLETIFPEINFDTMFIIGTLTYVILILKYIKDEIMRNIDLGKKHR